MILEDRNITSHILRVVLDFKINCVKWVPYSLAMKQKLIQTQFSQQHWEHYYESHLGLS